MIGGSYVGQTQWFAASRRAAAPEGDRAVRLAAEHHVAQRADLQRMLSPPDARNGWSAWAGARGRWPEFLTLFSEQQDYFEALPLSLAARTRRDDAAPGGTRGCEHPTYDDFWKQGSYDNHWRHGGGGAQHHRLVGHELPRRRRSTSRRCDSGDGRIAAQKLIIGPWPHWANRQRRLSGADFGEHAIIELDDYVIRFFDRWLKGTANGIEDEKPVHVFVIGANEWWAEDDWPLPGTEAGARSTSTRAGHANSLKGDGVLSTEPPGDEPPTSTATTRPTRCASSGTCARAGR